MVAEKTFNCVVIAPDGKLLDCRTSSVIFPAHDGQVGVWYNHEPMFCTLGLGIMQVKRESPEGEPGDAFLLVDGGFAVVCSNLLKVVSYDVVFPRQAKAQVVEQTIAGIKKKLSTGAFDEAQRGHQLRKVALLNRMLELFRQTVMPDGGSSGGVHIG